MWDIPYFLYTAQHTSEQRLYKVVSLQGMFNFKSWLQSEIKAWYIFKRKKSALLGAFKSS